MDVNPIRLSTQLYRLAQLIENLEHKYNQTEVRLVDQKRMLPAPELTT